jgi:tetratricopeptide (TPR) repeat protein
VSDTTPSPVIHLVVGDDEERVRSLAERLQGAGPRVEARPARVWPFSHPLVPPLPPGPLTVWAPHVHEAFETRQAPHTRLVTTQAHYLFTEWAARLASQGQATLVATARRRSLSRHAPEVLQRRGRFARVEIHDVEGVDPLATEAASATVPGGEIQAERLAAGFREAAAADRLRACVQALDLGRSAPALLATASACQEVNDLESAARDLDEAIAAAPEWAAAHFERGKVWLRLDDMDKAAGCFRAAVDRLPGFGGAWGNLGAALGELDRPAEALQAFERLLALDPASPQAHNNIGVLTRELGRLPESEEAFRHVIELEPNLAFGYYNLGHTLFLQGRYHAAASAYGQGQARDPDRNPVQATRLALCRLATGDARGALDELQRASAALPREYRRQVLADTSAVLWALVTHKPDLVGWQAVHEWVNGELSTLA